MSNSLRSLAMSRRSAFDLLRDGTLRLALEAPLPGMQSLLYRLIGRQHVNEPDECEWWVIIQSLAQLHGELSELLRLSQGNTMGRTRTAILEGLLAVHKAVVGANAMKHGEGRALVDLAVHTYEPRLAAPTSGATFLYVSGSDNGWAAKRVQVQRATKTLAYLQELDGPFIHRVKTHFSVTEGTVYDGPHKPWPRMGLQYAMDDYRKRTAKPGVTNPS